MFDYNILKVQKRKKFLNLITVYKENKKLFYLILNNETKYII